MVLSLAVLFLVFANAAAKALLYALRRRYLLDVDVVPILAAQVEQNVLTWFSSVLLLLAAAIMWAIGAAVRAERGRHASYWISLSVVLLLMSLDEAMALHERLPRILAPALNDPALGRNSWTVVGTALVVLLIAVYAPFLVRLPLRTKSLLVLAGSLHIVGALVVELTSQRLLRGAYDPTSMPYQLSVGLEEALEMIGVVLLIYTLLSYIGERWGTEVRIAHDATNRT